MSPTEDTAVDEAAALQESGVSWVTLPVQDHSRDGGPALCAAFILWCAENDAN